MKRIVAIVVTLIMVVSVLSVPLSAKVSDTSKFSNKIISINEYYDNSGDYTQSIIEALEVLKQSGGGTLEFPAGDYLIKPMQIEIPSNTKLLGTLDSTGKPISRIYTKESELYNFILRTGWNTSNIWVSNIVFDQMDDTTTTPAEKSMLGCSILAILDSNNIEVSGCTFKLYGTCAILSQSHYNTPTENLTINDNKAYFERRSSSLYDVSVFSIDGRNVVVTGNYVEGIYQSDNKYYKPRSAFEIHSPNCIVTGNSTLNAETGILHLTWPSMWTTFESSYNGNINISNNSISKSIIGIYLWNGNIMVPVETQNIVIENNNINLHAEKNFIPAIGIAVSVGDSPKSAVDKVDIISNSIEVTKESYISTFASVMNLVMPGEMTGAVLINLDSNVSNINIKNNEVIDYPHSFLNLYRIGGDGGTKLHSNVVVEDNYLENIAYVHTYGGKFDAVFNVGNVSNVEIKQNQVVEKNEDYIDLFRKFDNLSNVSFVDYITEVDNNNTTNSDNEYDLPSEPITNIYSYVIGFWANSKQIYATNIVQCQVGQYIITPNGEVSKIERVNGNYIYLTKEVTSWYDGKFLQGYIKTTEVSDDTENEQPISNDDPTRIYDNVLGAWGNSKQLYVYNIDQCKIGDVIITPNNEKSTITNMSTNYIFLDKAVTSWLAAKQLTLDADEQAQEEQNQEDVNQDDDVVNDIAREYNNVLSVWSNSKQAYTYNINQCKVGDTILTPTQQKVTISSIGANYLFFDTEITQWIGTKGITLVSEEHSETQEPIETNPVVEVSKVYNNVLGVWANSRQIYAYNISQCSVGDKFITVNNEIGIIESIGSNYLFLSNDVTKWYNEKELVYTD